MENATARFYCNMGYRENSTCRPTICKNDRWENYQPCTCKEIPTVPPQPSTHTTPTGRTPPPATPRDDSLLLRSISDKLQLMWITVGTGVFVVVIIALITALVLCSKFRYEMIFLRCLDNACYFINYWQLFTVVIAFHIHSYLLKYNSMLQIPGTVFRFRQTYIVFIS